MADGDTTASLAKKLALAGSVVTFIMSVVGGVYLFDDKYMSKEAHVSAMARVDEKLQDSQGEGFSRIDHMAEMNKMKFIDIELNLTNILIANKLATPDIQRSRSFESELRELELKRQFLIQHKSYGDNNDN